MGLMTTKVFTFKSIATLLFTLAISQMSSAENSQVVFETNRGNLEIELFDEQAPITVQNFLTYVNEGFYNGTIFHRVVPEFVIQGGGFTKELSKKKTKAPIKNEAKPELKNLRGTLSMARTSAPNSATSQFFINLVDNKSLDYRQFNVGYAVFGKITAGMLLVDEIANVRRGTVGILQNVPVDAIEIIKAYQVKTEQPAPEAEQPISENKDSSQGTDAAP